MYQESYCGSPVYPVVTYGVLQVYGRQGYRTLNVPKYVVFHQDGRALEEFKNLRKAKQWAKKNQNPMPDPWTSDEDFPVEDWKYDVANDDTRLGYLDWVKHQRDTEQHNSNHPCSLFP